MIAKSATLHQTSDDTDLRSDEEATFDQKSDDVTSTIIEPALSEDSPKHATSSTLAAAPELASDTGQQPLGFAPGVKKRKPVFKGENRREHHRSHVVLPYTMAYEDPYNPHARCQGYTEDLSIGGVSLFAAVNIPLGSPVAIRLEIVLYGMNTHVVATGKIVNHTFSSKGGGFRYGIQFQNVRQEYQKTIQTLQHAITKRMI